MNSATQSIGGDEVPTTDLIEQVERLARAGRERAIGAWFPLWCLGTATLASLAVDSTGDWEGLRIFWALAVPVLGFACAAFYGVRGAQPRDRTTWAALALMVGALAALVPAAWLVQGRWAPVALTAFVGVVLGGLGLLAGHRVSVFTGVAAAIGGLAVAVADPDRPYTWMALVTGVLVSIGAAASMSVAEQ